MYDKDQNKAGGSSFFGGFTDLITTLKNLVGSANTINQTIAKSFPQATGTAASATGGAATLPANPVGFVQIFVPSLNATVKVPYYNT